jgi:hypothetical protein
MADLIFLAEVQRRAVALCGPARGWAGRCYEVASRCARAGIVRGAAVYGHWRGEVAPRSYFGRLRRQVPFYRHGWVVLDDGRVCDFTRWAFTGGRSFVYVGSAGPEYDEGGNVVLGQLRGEPPRFDPEGDVRMLGDDLLSSPAWEHVEGLLGGHYHFDLGEVCTPGAVTVEQVLWLANLPYAELSPHADEVYAAVERLGLGAFVPIDNRRRAARRGRGG